MARKVMGLSLVRKTLYIDKSLYQQLQSKKLSCDSPLESMKDKLIYCASEFKRFETQNSAYGMYRKSYVHDLVEELKPMFEEEQRRTREIVAFRVIIQGVFENVFKAKR
jgi:hypothetical protein